MLILIPLIFVELLLVSKGHSNKQKIFQKIKPLKYTCPPNKMVTFLLPYLLPGESRKVAYFIMSR